MCKAVVIVGDERSLLETVGAIDPRVVVLDLSFVRTDLAGFMSRLRSHSPDARIIILSGHVERQVVQTMLDFGAAAVVIKGRIASDLVPAVEAVLRGE
jgi:two-component system NarL family response regulator